MSALVVCVRDCPPGWERDLDFVYVGRAGHGHDGRWGNRHRVGWCSACARTHARGEAVALDWEEVLARWRVDEAYRAAVEGLRGRNLVCFCEPLGPCHARNYVRLLEGRLS